MGDCYGFKLVYGGALACNIAGVLLFLLGSKEIPIYSAFTLLGFGAWGWMLAASTMVLEFGETQDTPMRLGFVTTVEGAIAAIDRFS